MSDFSVSYSGSSSSVFATTYYGTYLMLSELRVIAIICMYLLTPVDTSHRGDNMQYDKTCPILVECPSPTGQGEA